MFVVMRAGAGEAEVIGVKGLILAEGLTPFENAGADRTVIAVVGEIGRRGAQLRGRLEGMPGVASVTAISGRGVGMDAVRDFLERAQGSIALRFTDENVGEAFRQFQTVVTLPARFAVVGAFAGAKAVEAS